MPAKISEGIRRLLETPNFADLATLMSDEPSPQGEPPAAVPSLRAAVCGLATGD